MSRHITRRDTDRRNAQRRVGGIVPFTPEGAGGIVWLAEGTVPFLIGAAVVSWPSRAGGHTFTDGGAVARRPTYSATGFNALNPGVTFDGVDDWLQLAAGIAAMTGTGAAVYATVIDATTTSGILIEGTPNGISPGAMGLFVNANVAGRLQSVIGDPGGQYTTISAAISLATPAVIGARWDRTQLLDAQHDISVNNVTEPLAVVSAGTALGNFSPNQLTLGARTGGVAPASITVNAIVIYPGARPSAGLQTQTFDFLRARVGL